MVLLRKSIPQSRNLKAAAELNVRHIKKESTVYNEENYWRVVNVLVRVFGIMCFIVGIIFIITTIILFSNEKAFGNISTASGNAPIEMGIASLICLVLGVLFVSVKAYRPDLSGSEKNNKKINNSKASWWTGELK